MDGLIPQTLFDWIESSAGRAVLSTVQGKAQLPSDTVYRIHDVYDHEDVPDALIDKHKVLQILVNLLSNARDALRDANKERKDLTLRIRREGDDRVRIDVVDNGIGISGDTLTRLFALGSACTAALWRPLNWAGHSRPAATGRGGAPRLRSNSRSSRRRCCDDAGQPHEKSANSGDR